MSKTRRTTTKRRSRSVAPPSRRSVTRREYAELVVRLGAVELQAHRNRATLDLQGKRIAQMQEELNLLHASAATPRPTDMPGIAIPPPSGRVES